MEGFISEGWFLNSNGLSGKGRSMNAKEKRIYVGEFKNGKCEGKGEYNRVFLV